MKSKNIIFILFCCILNYQNIEFASAQNQKINSKTEEIKPFISEIISEDSIPDLSLDGFGLSEDDGGLKGVSWKQDSRQEFLNVLESIKLSNLPKIYKSIITKLISSRGISDSKYSNNEILRTRLLSLLTAGENELVLKILDSFPKAIYNGILWQTYFDAMFMTESVNEVCKKTGQLRKKLNVEPSIFMVTIACLLNSGQDVTKLIDDFVLKSATNNINGKSKFNGLFQRISLMLEATRLDDKRAFINNDLRITELFLLFPNKESWDNIPYERTSAGIKKAVFVQYNKNFLLLSSSLAEGLAESNIVNISEYPKLIYKHPLLKNWGISLLEANNDLLIAKRVDMVWQEKPYKSSYLRWLSNFANNYNEKKIKNLWNELPHGFYLISNSKKLNEVIKGIPITDIINQERVTKLLMLLENNIEDIDTESEIINEGLTGNLDWKKIINSSEFNYKDNETFIKWSNSIFYSLQNKNYTYTNLLIASKISGSKELNWNNSELTKYTVAILTNALVKLGMEEIAKIIIRDYMVHKWIDSPN